MVVAQDVMKLILEFVDKATAPIKKTANSLKQLGKSAQAMSAPTAQVSKEMQTLQKWSKTLKTPISDLRKGVAAQNLVWTESGRLQDLLTGKMVKTGVAMGKAKKIASAFKFEWLGVMFAGMALTRVFKTIFRATYETFTKANGLITKQGQAVLALTAQWELLKYSIFNAIIGALEPLIPTIVKIIARISEWVNNHPKLTAAIVLTGLAVGIFALVVGQLFLAWNAIKALQIGAIIRSIGAAMIAQPAIIVAVIVVVILLGLWLKTLGKIAKQHPKIWEKIKEAWKLVTDEGKAAWKVISDLVVSLTGGKTVTLSWAKAVGILTTAILTFVAVMVRGMLVGVYAFVGAAQIILGVIKYIAGETKTGVADMAAGWKNLGKALDTPLDQLKLIKDGWGIMKDIKNITEDTTKAGEKAAKETNIQNEVMKEFNDTIQDTSDQLAAIDPTAISENLTKNIKIAAPNTEKLNEQIQGLKGTIGGAEAGTKKFSDSLFDLLGILFSVGEEAKKTEKIIGPEESLTKIMLEAIPVVGDLTGAFKTFGKTLKEKVEIVILTVEAAMYGIIDATQTFIQLSTGTITALNAEATAFDNATAAVNRYADAKRKAAGRGMR